MNLLDSQFQLTPFFRKKEGLNCKKIVKKWLSSRTYANEQKWCINKVQKVGVILSTLSVDKIVYKALNFGSKPNFYRIFNKLYKN